MPCPLTRRAWPQAAVVAAVATGLLAGCGGSHPKRAISIQVKVTSYTSAGKARSSPYSLTCGPTGGTLPLAALVCTDIDSHPQAMLAPVPARSVCVGSPFMAQVEVKVMRGPRGLTFSPFAGNPNCDWPGGTPIAIYYAASVKDTHTLSRVEPLLRCEDDPMLLAKPTPWASVVACTRGLWTPASERDIRKAEGAPQLAPLSPSTLFPRDIGAIHCRIPAGGPDPTNAGRRVRRPSHRATVREARPLRRDLVAGRRRPPPYLDGQRFDPCKRTRPGTAATLEVTRHVPVASGDCERREARAPMQVKKDGLSVEEPRERLTATTVRPTGVSGGTPTTLPAIPRPPPREPIDAGRA